MFLTLKEELVNPNCIPSHEITRFTQVTSIFSMRYALMCELNTNRQNYTIHNSIFAYFFWLGVLSLLIRLTLFIIEKIKNGQSKHF